MGYAIALGGKGGTGKTTIAGLIIRYMLKRGMKPLLAIDADSNSNLNDVLGMSLEETLSEAREDMKTKVPTGMTKDIYMEMKMEQALVEGEGFDLTKVPSPLAGENIHSEHGRGIYLVNMLMDEVHFERGGCEIHMRKGEQPTH